MVHERGRQEDHEGAEAREKPTEAGYCPIRREEPFRGEGREEDGQARHERAHDLHGAEPEAQGQQGDVAGWVLGEPAVVGHDQVLEHPELAPIERGTRQTALGQVAGVE